jgi:deoxyhypusine synthase
MLFFHSYKSPGLVVDVVGDIRAINDSAMRATPRRTGMIILGGGEQWHHMHALIHVLIWYSAMTNQRCCGVWGQARK